MKISLFYISFFRYDKATLATLVENRFWKSEYPEFYDAMSQSSAHQTEYKVEQLHGIIRRNTCSFFEPDEIIKIAKCLCSKNFKSDFEKFYGSSNQKKDFCPDMEALSNAGLLHLTKVFDTIANNIGNSKVRHTLAV